MALLPSVRPRCHPRATHYESTGLAAAPPEGRPRSPPPAPFRGPSRGTTEQAAGGYAWGRSRTTFADPVSGERLRATPRRSQLS